MDRLFRPWRLAYVSGARSEPACVLCTIGSSGPADDERLRVVARAERHYVVLNAFPYNTGHLMIVPYDHVACLADLAPIALAEIMATAARAESVLGEVYRPEGLNLGMNLGRSAGAGIADHLHLHVVPRWGGDTNFMTVTGDARILPESLDDTWRKLHGRI